MKNKKNAKTVSNPIERMGRPHKEEREILGTADSKLGGRHLNSNAWMETCLWGEYKVP